MNAPAMRQSDALCDRLARLRARRREAGWAEELLGLGRELVLADAGAVLALEAEGWIAIAPALEEAPPEAWARLAEAAVGGRGIAAAAVGHDGRWVFAVALGLTDAPGPSARPAALVMEVGSAIPMDLVLTRERMAFLGALTEASGAEAAFQARAPHALAATAADALVGAADRAEGLHAAAAALVLPGAERVALVLPERGEVAVSDQRQIEPGAELPRSLLALGQEALDRGAARLVAAGGATTPAERGFAEAFGARPLLLLPAAPLVLIVSFAPGTLLPESAVERLAVIPRLLAAVVAGRRRRRRLDRRLVAFGAVAAVLGLLAVLPRAAVVEAPVVLRPEMARVVAAPFDGLLEASSVQPGDRVTGQETSLARLATREIELELAAARARAANDLRDAAVARSAAQPAQEQISLLSARRAEAQVALLEHRLRLADIRAPADGVIIAGDLRRSLGQPVSRGQVLFEIALPGPLRAEVLVLDEDIPAIREGQAVRFATAAEPGQPREALVERIRPMAEVVEGRNVFRVIARIGEGEDVALRPGMEGWARIETGRTTWLAAMLRDPVRWVRRMFWI
jgi:hypothetical protein